MAARTCLLCGKALGRFAATGEDFCSREHRNQYRLRQGMERLAEANQVASVMRRREHPRHIPAEQLRAAGDARPREILYPFRAEFLEPNLPRIAVPGTALRGAGAFLRPAARGQAAPRLLSAPTMTVSAVRRAPSVTASLYAHVAPAPVVKPRASSVEAPARRRVAVAPKQKMSPLPMRHVSTAAPAAFGAPARKLDAGVKGRALRVSLSTAFRLPESRFRVAPSAHPAIAGIRWPEVLPIDAVRRYRVEAKACAIDTPQPEMRLPGGPGEAFAGNFRWPGPMSVSISSVDAARGQRTTFVPFSSEERR